MRSSFGFLAGVLLLATGATAQTPTVANVTPNSVVAGSTAFLITVTGNNFQPATQVTWNGVPLSTNFFNAQTLTASVPASFVTGPEIDYVGVSGGQGLVQFTVLPGPLAVATNSLPNGTVGQSYSATLLAKGGTPPYSWALQGGLPPGLVLSPNGNISGIPTASGSFIFSVQVIDAARSVAASALIITIAGPSFSITTASLPNGTVGQAYSQQIATTGGTSPYQWSGQNLPPGLSIAPATGLLSGTPSQAGTFTFTVQATDSSSPQATASRSYAVSFAAPALTIGTLPPLLSGSVGTVYSQSLIASGGVPPYTWSVVSGFVPGLSLDAATGVLQGTPTSAGTYSVGIRVSDTAGQQATQTYALTITPATLTIVASPAPPNGTAGTPYPPQKFLVVGGKEPYTWSASGVPGLSIDPVTGTLSGTPTVAGNFTLSLQVSDANGLGGSRNFTIIINPAPGTLKITSPNQLPDATLGSTLSYTMTANGGAPPYTWSANGLPAGLSINSVTGTISGTLASAGLTTFVVTVRDASLHVAQDNFTINVLPPPVPSISVSGLPDAVEPLKQYPIRISLSEIYPYGDISGSVALTSAPADSGPTDNSIQFSSGGRTANFTIPSGSTTALLQIQVGTVAGTISATLRQVTVGGLDVTPTPLAAVSTQIPKAAPVITSATFTRNGNTITVRVAGYATSREITQATFTFSTAAGQSLATSQFTLPVDSTFAPYFGDAGNAAFGSQFVFTQPFTIQGDATAVIPQSVTLTNRAGSANVPVTQ